MEPNSVIGSDSRVENWDNRGVAKIMGNPSEEGYLGTGFVVGKHTIATAAHVVFDKSKGTANKLTGILLFDKEQNWHSVTPKEIHIPTSFKNTSTSGFDYALITVENDLSAYMSFNLGTITDKADDNQISIESVGFPQKSNNSGVINDGDDHTEMYSTGVIKSCSVNGVFYHDADTSPGNSGGPIYKTETLNGQTYHTVVGIHIASGSGYNVATRLDAQVLKFFNGNDNIN